VNPSTGTAELAGVDRDTITLVAALDPAAGVAARNLKVVDAPVSAAQLAAAQKATARPNPKSSPGHS